jgi:protein-S-isoprenylcysteine O-methyltransferase Ste14
MKSRNTFKSFLFVLVQFLSLALIGLSGPLLPRSTFLLIVELLGITLGVWAVIAMRIGNFNITPDPFKWTKLVANGPYALIRHPMYLALLLTTLPLIINHLTISRLVLWLILLTGLLLKLNYEEGLLTGQLEGYREYSSETWKLIPFLY